MVSDVDAERADAGRISQYPRRLKSSERADKLRKEDCDSSGSVLLVGEDGGNLGARCISTPFVYRQP